MNAFDIALDAQLAQAAAHYTVRPIDAVLPEDVGKRPAPERAGFGYRSTYEAEGFRARVHGHDRDANPYASHPFRRLAAMDWDHGWTHADMSEQPA